MGLEECVPLVKLTATNNCQVTYFLSEGIYNVKGLKGKGVILSNPPCKEGNS